MTLSSVPLSHSPATDGTLEAGTEQEAQERLYVADEIGTLEGLTTTRAPFRDCQEAARDALAAMGPKRDSTGILASPTVFPDQMKAALSAVTLREPRPLVSILAPASRQKADRHAPALIEDRSLPRRKPQRRARDCHDHLRRREACRWCCALSRLSRRSCGIPGPGEQKGRAQRDGLW